MMPHEKLDVFRVAVEFDRMVFDALRDRRGDDKNQLLRASASVQNNIAEAASERLPGEKARLYRVARREAAESDVTWSRIHRRNPLDELTFRRGKSLIRRTIRMLTRLIDTHGGRAGK